MAGNIWYGERDRKKGRAIITDNAPAIRVMHYHHHRHYFPVVLRLSNVPLYSIIPAIISTYAQPASFKGKLNLFKKSECL